MTVVAQGLVGDACDFGDLFVTHAVDSEVCELVDLESFLDGLCHGWAPLLGLDHVFY